MGNMCSADAFPANKKKRRKDGKAKRKGKQDRHDDTAHPPPQQDSSNPVANSKSEAVNPLLVDDRHVTQSSSDLELTRSSSGLRQALTTAVAKQAPERDFEPLTEAKLGFLRAWVDGIRKKNLLDPQDVAGLQRQTSIRFGDGDERKRSSIVETLRLAQIEEVTKSRGNRSKSSMDVGQSVGSDEPL